MTNTPWIEWNGGECPVDPETLVLVRFRPHPWEGKPIELKVRQAASAGGFVWQHHGSSGDIVAYRIASDTTK